MKEYNTHRRLRTGRLQSVGICLMPTSATVRRGLFVRPMLRGGEDLQAVRIAFRVDSTSSGFLEGVPQLESWVLPSTNVVSTTSCVWQGAASQGMWISAWTLCFPEASGMENIQAQSPCLELCAMCWVYNPASQTLRKDSKG